MMLRHLSVYSLTPVCETDTHSKINIAGKLSKGSLFQTYSFSFKMKYAEMQKIKTQFFYSYIDLKITIWVHIN